MIRLQSFKNRSTTFNNHLTIVQQSFNNRSTIDLQLYNTLSTII